jgi:hypothetical protein
VSDEAGNGLAPTARWEGVGVTTGGPHFGQEGTSIPEIARVDTLREPAWDRGARQTLRDDVG